MSRGQSPGKLIPPYCKGCVYRSANKTFPCCDYFSLTGHLRGCSSKNCIHKAVGRRPRNTCNLPDHKDDRKKRAERKKPLPDGNRKSGEVKNILSE